VNGAVALLPRCPDVLSLDPKRLADVFADIEAVGATVGRRREAEALVAGLRRRLTAVASSRAGKPRPRVAALEWLDPPFTAGHWVPEMIDRAGGEDAFAASGDPSRRATWDEIAAGDPEVVLVMPCGFDEAGARAQMALLEGHPAWESLAAVRAGRAYALDANGLFSRPGPRVVDGVERLAEIFGRWSGSGPLDELAM
jgi:iron complex transport system substrate-binding protein